MENLERPAGRIGVWSILPLYSNSDAKREIQGACFGRVRKRTDKGKWMCSSVEETSLRGDQVQVKPRLL